MKVRTAGLIIKGESILVLKYQYGQHIVYGLPGGNIEFGEKAEDCLKRELSEELSLIATVGKHRFLGQTINEQNGSVLHLIYEVSAFDGTPKIDPIHTKANDLVWLKLDLLKDANLYPNIGKFILEKNAPVYLGQIDQQWF